MTRDVLSTFTGTSKDLGMTGSKGGGRQTHTHMEERGRMMTKDHVEMEEETESRFSLSRLMVSVYNSLLISLIAAAVQCDITVFLHFSNCVLLLQLCHLHN